DQAWARRFFPGQSAVGKRLKGGGCSTCDWTTVVGVVSPVKYDGLSAPDQGVVYTPMAERGEGLAGSFSGRTRVLVVRTAGASSAAPPRGLSFLVGALAAVALALSIVGIYGVMAHYVQQQSKDISIRLALGGSPAHVLGLNVREGMKVVTAGVVVGLAVAAGAARVMSS